MNLQKQQPIGLFDSGLGGLSVAAAVKNLLPNEQIIYYGDTAHLPYGDKSQDAIRAYSKSISEFLVNKGCKAVLIACNTASSAAYDTVFQAIGDKAIVLDVIEPTVNEVCNRNQNTKIGVIGTKGTIGSGAYPRRILARKPSFDVRAMATPLLVPMIEEGFIYDDISNAIIRTYLSKDKLTGIDSLILGCTHYPLIKNQIRKFFNFNVKVIDSAFVAANHLRNQLKDNELLSDSLTGEHKFYVSDYTEMFGKIAEMFFDETVPLEALNIWKEA